MSKSLQDVKDALWRVQKISSDNPKSMAFALEWHHAALVSLLEHLGSRPASPPADETATGGEFSREGLEAWAKTFAAGPHDEKECRQCRGIMNVEPGDEPTVLCHSCAQSFIEGFVPGLLASALRAKGEMKPRFGDEAIRYNLRIQELRAGVSSMGLGGVTRADRARQILERDNELRDASPPAPTPTDEPGKAGGAKCKMCGGKKVITLPLRRGDTEMSCPNCKGTGQSAEGTGAEGEYERAMDEDCPPGGIGHHEWVCSGDSNDGRPYCKHCGVNKPEPPPSPHALACSANPRFRGEPRYSPNACSCGHVERVRIEKLDRALRAALDDLLTAGDKRRDLESKLAAAEKERDALSKKVEAWEPVVRAAIAWEDAPETDDDHVGRALLAAISDLPADFRPGEREAKGEAR